MDVTFVVVVTVVVDDYENEKEDVVVVVVVSLKDGVGTSEKDKIIKHTSHTAFAACHARDGIALPFRVVQSLTILQRFSKLVALVIIIQMSIQDIIC